MKRIIAAAMLLAAISFGSDARAAVVPAPVPDIPLGSQGAANPWIVWAVGGCVVSVMISAAHAGWRDNRELTLQEAWSCGVLYWFSTPQKHVMKRTRHKH